MNNHKNLNTITWFAAAVVLLGLLIAGCSQGAEETGGSASAAEQPAPVAIETPPEPEAEANGPITIDSEGQVPFYARFGENETFGDGDWTVIVFYRPPECIPADFNLNQFFDFPGENSPGAFACGPTTTTGTETWATGPETDPAPLVAELTGRGAVPVWFIAQGEMDGAMADGLVTVSELAALESRLIGEASSYTELLHPSQSNAQTLIQFKAEGALEDGRDFSVDVSYGATDVEDHTTIEIAG